MESILESQRTWHEERERCVDLMVKEFLNEKRTQKERINSDQRVKQLVERHRGATEKLSRAYRDDDGERGRELQAIAGPNEFAEFYSRLKILKDVHRKNPNENGTPLTIDFQEMANFMQNPDRMEKDIVRFTDEEGYGRFLDLHLMFEQYVNLKGIQRVDYLTYLSNFDHLFEVPRDPTKKTGAYKEYVTALLDYLIDFTSRAKPLINLEKEFATADEEFEQKWSEGKVPGWGKEKTGGALANAGVHLDLAPFNTVEELEAVGLDRLKSALIALNLKCGGTLRERAERLFATKGKKPEELPRQIVKEPPKKNAQEEKREHTLAQLEYRIYRLTDFLSDERAATKENVERKQGRAVGEEEEEDEEIEDTYEEDVEDDGVPYNPKNLPLGWDGKPIPYWLYKLHGLNIGYACEICGNQVYKGPKAFQRHFTEWRHSHGMRCLGIPNTAHFANITKINDALELWKKLSSEKETHRWNPEHDEEFEDSHGNVVNRKTYEDLKRQGLL